MLEISIDFGKTVRTWDGFGVNYVETSQTRDYSQDPQDYGGFSTLSEERRREVVSQVFGDQGLRPSLVKMFLDPFHQSRHGDLASTRIDPLHYDHQATTQWQRYFVKEGLALTRARGEDLSAIVTLYGPPAWMTKQRVVRGRDLDPAYHTECAKYLAAYAQYLRAVEGIPVRYVSIHNEGEDWIRWHTDGLDHPDLQGHDHNLLWTPAQVCAFMPLLRRVLDDNGMADVGVTPGETSTWPRFQQFGYADAIAGDAEALGSLGLVTSHGFYGVGPALAFGDARSAGTDVLRAKRAELHSWTTSTGWGRMDVDFLWQLCQNIDAAKVNGIIPWACIQNHSRWVGGDPNPGCAFLVDGTGGCAVQPGYHYYRHLSRAGQGGMQVVGAWCNHQAVSAVAFGGTGTRHPDAIVLINTLWNQDFAASIQVSGCDAESFDVTRTSPQESSEALDTVAVKAGRMELHMPRRSVTTLVARS